MTLLWCIAAIAIALLVSRYNQSNKLFWILVISFLAGIAGAAVFDAMTSKELPEAKLTQVCPTQGVSDVSDVLNPLAGTGQIPTLCLELNPVSKDYISAICELSPLHSRAIPTHTPPPKKILS